MPKGNLSLTWPLIGNEHITDFLEAAMIKNEAGGTYIFNGPDNLGKTTLAVHFAKSLLCQNRTAEGKIACLECPSCKRFFVSKTDDQSDQLEIGGTHADYHVIKKDKDKKNISIEQVRDLILSLSMTSFLNSYKIGIIKHAENLSEQASNALLKTLEEPKDKVVLILITSDIDSLPQTIVSRARILNFRPVKADTIYDYLVKDMKAPRSQAKDLSRLCLGRPALAIKFLENRDFYESYSKRAGIFLDLIGQNINERFAAVQSLIDDKLSNQENAKHVLRILEIWQGLVRDLMLVAMGRPDLIQHYSYQEKMVALQNRLSIRDFVGFSQALKQARGNIAANVSSKMVLENITLYI